MMKGWRETRKAPLVPMRLAIVTLVVLAWMPGKAAWAQLGAVAGDVDRRPGGGAGGQIVCDGRMGCAPLRPGCRVVRGGGSFGTAVICGTEKGGKRARQKSMSGSEN
jgi:hypothetical protein